VGSPMGERRTCRVEGERASAGEIERMGGRKKGKEKKKRGKGR
jgi:hypothetical protein